MTIAIASAPTCASLTEPSVMPATSHSISSALERRAVALAADDLLGEEASCRSLPTKPSSSRARSPAARWASVRVCSWLSGTSDSPSARLEMAETAATRIPAWRARIVSWTVDMPTASAPMVRKARISAGVSKLGPLTAR